MSEFSEDRATAIANELKALIRRFEHRSFTGAPWSHGQCPCAAA